MKKTIIIVLLLFLCIGCSKKLNIDNTKIIKYNGVVLTKEDTYNTISYINNLTFKDYNEDINFKTNLSITTNDNIYNFEVKDNIIICKDGDKYLYAYTTDFYSILNNLQLIYTDDSFYNINYYVSYFLNKEDLYIKLDNTNNYYVINTKYDLYNFRINEVEFDKEGINDINLLYQNDSISNNKIVIRSSANNIKITFENKYGYIATIYPSKPLNEENIVFSSSYIQKENSY